MRTVYDIFYDKCFRKVDRNVVRDVKLRLWSVQHLIKDIKMVIDKMEASLSFPNFKLKAQRLYPIPSLHAAIRGIYHGTIRH